MCLDQRLCMFSTYECHNLDTVKFVYLIGYHLKPVISNKCTNQSQCQRQISHKHTIIN